MEAWVKRETEQQELFEALESEVFETAEDSNKTQDEFRLLLCSYLIDEMTDPVWANDEENQVLNLVSNLIEEIKEFSRTEVERKALMARYARKLLKSSFSKIEGDYLHEQNMKASPLYNGRGSMDEVSV